MRISFTAQKVKDGDYLPIWYYGLSYHDFEKDFSFFYPIPLNFLIRWFRNLKINWDQWRQGLGEKDAEKMDFYNKSYKEGYQSAKKHYENIIEILRK